MRHIQRECGQAHTEQSVASVCGAVAKRHTGHVPCVRQRERHAQWKVWLQRMVITPDTAGSRRSRHTGHEGNSVSAAPASDNDSDNELFAATTGSVETTAVVVLVLVVDDEVAPVEEEREEGVDEEEDDDDDGGFVVKVLEIGALEGEVLEAEGVGVELED